MCGNISDEQYEGCFMKIGIPKETGRLYACPYRFHNEPDFQSCVGSSCAAWRKGRWSIEGYCILVSAPLVQGIEEYITRYREANPVQ